MCKAGPCGGAGTVVNYSLVEGEQGWKARGGASGLDGNDERAGEGDPGSRSLRHYGGQVHTGTRAIKT